MNLVLTEPQQMIDRLIHARRDPEERFISGR